MRAPLFPSRIFPFFIVLACVSLALPAYSQTFDIRAKTRDNIRALLLDTTVPTAPRLASGKAFQGSFGSPALNDKGDVAYACILAGTGITAFSSNSVVFRAKGPKSRPVVAIQSYWTTLNDNYMNLAVGPNQFPVSGSAYVYRIGKDLGFNNKREIAFMAEMPFQYYTVDDKGKKTYHPTETGAYGLLVPLSNARSFLNTTLNSYLQTFSNDFLTRTLSLDLQGSLPFNGAFLITPTKSVEGFAFATGDPSGLSPYSAQTIVATVESNVIGLPYLATYQSFSDAIIANGDKTFVTAQISDGNNEFDGIWQGNSSDLQPVVVKTHTSPDGGKFTTFGEKTGPSRSGKFCAFLASTSVGTTGVFRSTVVNTWTSPKSTEKILIAKLGDKAPTNSQAGTLGTFGGFSLAACSDSGQVALIGNVNGKDGIWLSDAKGENLKLVVIEGQTLTIGKTQKTLNKIDFNPVSGINRSGKVAFTASFTDRTSAVIVATL